MNSERERDNSIIPVAHPHTQQLFEIASDTGLLKILNPKTRILIEEYYGTDATLKGLRRYSGLPIKETGELILNGLRTLRGALKPEAQESFEHLTLKYHIFSKEAQERARLASIGNVPVNKGRRKI